MRGDPEGAARGSEYSNLQVFRPEAKARVALVEAQQEKTEEARTMMGADPSTSVSQAAVRVANSKAWPKIKP